MMRAGRLGDCGGDGASLALMPAPRSARAPPSAVSKWEAGTCKSDAAGNCTYVEPRAQFFTQAAGTRRSASPTSSSTPEPARRAPDGNVKTSGSTCREGLNVNPQAVPQCESDLRSERRRLRRRAQVGTSEVDRRQIARPAGRCRCPVPVYNLDPATGRTGAASASRQPAADPDANVFLDADVAWDSDYHEGFTISDSPDDPLPLVREPPRLRRHRQAAATLPDHGQPVQRRPRPPASKVDSYAESRRSFLSLRRRSAAGGNIDGCQSVPFAPGGRDRGRRGADAPTRPPARRSTSTVPQAAAAAQLLDRAGPRG